jgi:ketosteroid isomerase-like protein
MRWLSEDPWTAVGVLVVVAIVLLGLLKLRQEGRFLIAALAVLGLAGLVLVVERAWVTEAERVEAVVYELAAATRRSDAAGALALVTPDVVVTDGNGTSGGPVAAGGANPARALIEARLGDTIFDFFNASHVRVTVAPDQATASAEMRVYLAGSIDYQGTRINFATDGNGSDWRLDFRKVGDAWRVEKIAAVRLPRGWRIPGL